MDIADIVKLVVDSGVAAGVVVFLWKGMLPELRASRNELRAVEKHLATAGGRSVVVEGAILQGFQRLEDRIGEVQKDTAFLVSAAQRANGRTTRPTDAPDEEKP